MPIAVLRDEDGEENPQVSQLEFFWDGDFTRRPPLGSENGQRPREEAPAETPLDWKIPLVLRPHAHEVTKG